MGIILWILTAITAFGQTATSGRTYSAEDVCNSINAENATGHKAKQLAQIAAFCEPYRAAQIKATGQAEHAQVLAEAVAKAITATDGEANTYSNTSKGEFATGPAATARVRGYYGYSNDQFNNWVTSQAWAHEMLNPMTSVPPPEDTKTPVSRSSSSVDRNKDAAESVED